MKADLTYGDSERRRCEYIEEYVRLSKLILKWC